MAKTDKKLPWFKFYPSDWSGDRKLHMCSIGARGLWIEMVCVMHEAEPYGHLITDGKPVTNRQIASLAGISLAECGKYLMELESAGVYSRTESKTIYSRRMVRDKAKADKDRENGKGGGNPVLTGEDKGGVNPQDKAQKPEAKAKGQNQTAAAAVALDEIQEKQALALRVMLSAIRSGKKWAIPNLDQIDVWIAEGIPTGTISAACAPLLNRKEDMASLAYCDGAVRAAHSAAPVLQVVSAGVWVDEGTLEWNCWQRVYNNGRGSPVKDQRDDNGQATGRRGWEFPSLMPPGFNDFGERIAPSEENAA